MAELGCLPAELLSQIFKDLPTHSLKDVRLQNRKMAKLACPYLFRQISLKMTPQSFKTFNNIANHAVFSPLVKTLHFDRRILDLEHWTVQIRHYEDWVQYMILRYILQNDPKGELNICVNALDDMQYEVLSEVYDAFEALCHWQDRMISRDTNLEYLTLLFGKLPNLKAITLQYENKPMSCETWRRWYPTNQFAREFDSTMELAFGGFSPPYHLQEVHCDRTLAFLSSSNSALRSVEICGIYLSQWLRFLGADPLSPDRFSRLRSLSLGFQTTGNDTESFAALVDLVASATDLQVLRLTFRHYARVEAETLKPQDLTHLFDGTTHWPSLKKCTLQGFSTTTKALQLFLLRHSSTVRKLHLGDVTFIGEGNDFHRYFFSFLAEQLKLDKVTFKGLLAGQENIKTYNTSEVPVTDQEYIQYLRRVDPHRRHCDGLWWPFCLRYRLQRYITGEVDHEIPLVPSFPLPDPDDRLNPQNTIVWQATRTFQYRTQRQKADGSWYWLGSNTFQ